MLFLQVKALALGSQGSSCMAGLTEWGYGFSTWSKHLLHTVITWPFHVTKILRFGKLPLSVQNMSFHALCICSGVHMLTAIKEIFTHYYQTRQEFMNHVLCLEKVKQVKGVSDYLCTFLSSWSCSCPFSKSSPLAFAISLRVWMFIAVCLQAAKPVLVWGRRTVPKPQS